MRVSEVARERGSGECGADREADCEHASDGLDERMELLPVGVKGELYIGGAGVARGYWNRPELTAEKFVPNPYGGAGERLYRSGDVVRWRDAGELEYLGRMDEQVKIRGYRIEPGEVEAVLREHGGVREATVVVGEEKGGGKRLLGYVVYRDGQRVESSHLRQYVQDVAGVHGSECFVGAYARCR